MSTTSRIVTGSLGSWAIMAVRFISQLILVPVYLTYWSPELYGLWLSVLAALSLFQTLDFGHVEYLGFEFLKIGRTESEHLHLKLWSGLNAAIFISLIEAIAIFIAIHFNLIHLIWGEIQVDGYDLSGTTGIVFLLLYLAWVINGYIGGITQRALYPFGYYPRVNWWGFGYAAITSLIPVIAVVNGGGLLTVGLVLASSDFLFTLIYYYDLVSLLKKEKIWNAGSKLRIGFNDYVQSLALSAKEFLESLHHQGVRVVLAPLSGGAGVAAFSTMRTGANVFLQGLSTVTNPLMPELMRFLNQKDQERTEVSFGTVWMIIMIFAPAVVILQVFIEPLYNIWTRNSLPFNPMLFALLSLSVLVYGLAKPAMAVVRGNNLLRSQFYITALSSVIIVGGMFVLVPVLGILGAGIPLLIAELASLFGYRLITKKWFKNNNLVWPSQSFSITAISVSLAAMAMAVIVWFPELKWVTLVISLPLLIWNIKRYWDSLPELANTHLKEISKKAQEFIKNILNFIVIN